MTEHAHVQEFRREIALRISLGSATNVAKNVKNLNVLLLMMLIVHPFAIRHYQK